MPLYNKSKSFYWYNKTVGEWDKVTFYGKSCPEKSATLQAFSPDIHVPEVYNNLIKAADIIENFYLIADHKAMGCQEQMSYF